MVNEVRTWLKDIDQAIREINSFIPEKKILLIFKMI
jgi:hypothetical protein